VLKVLKELPQSGHKVHRVLKELADHRGLKGLVDHRGLKGLQVQVHVFHLFSIVTVKIVLIVVTQTQQLFNMQIVQHLRMDVIYMRITNVKTRVFVTKISCPIL